MLVLHAAPQRFLTRYKNSSSDSSKRGAVVPYFHYIVPVFFSFYDSYDCSCGSSEYTSSTGEPFESTMLYYWCCRAEGMDVPRLHYLPFVFIVIIHILSREE